MRFLVFSFPYVRFHPSALFSSSMIFCVFSPAPSAFRFPTFFFPFLTQARPVQSPLSISFLSFSISVPHYPLISNTSPEHSISPVRSVFSICLRTHSRPLFSKPFAGCASVAKPYSPPLELFFFLLERPLFHGWPSFPQ